MFNFYLRKRETIKTRETHFELNFQSKTYETKKNYSLDCWSCAVRMFCSMRRNHLVLLNWKLIETLAIKKFKSEAGVRILGIWFFIRVKMCFPVIMRTTSKEAKIRIENICSFFESRVCWEFRALITDDLIGYLPDGQNNQRCSNLGAHFEWPGNTVDWCEACAESTVQSGVGFSLEHNN